METIDLDLDNENEMTFRVQIEGTRPGKPHCRLMIESSEITHTINGDFLKNDEVAILIPTMQGILKEGTYDSYLEVLVDDRVFIPLELKINFEKSLKVVAETIKRKQKQKVITSASLLSAEKKHTEKVVTENKQKINETIHPAKKRRDEKIRMVQKESKNNNIYSESDIMNLVRKIRSKTS